MQKAMLSRREALGLLAGTSVLSSAPPAGSRQASGIKIGEVTTDSALIWARRTARSERKGDGYKAQGRTGELPPDNIEVTDMEGSCPGEAGSIRVTYAPTNTPLLSRSTNWVRVGADGDYSHRFALRGLKPYTEYSISVETRSVGSETDAPVNARFRTAPGSSDARQVSFAVVTGQAYVDLDHREGFLIYDAFRKLRPDFLVLTGDNVYYDSEDPRAVNTALARYHWERMYSLPKIAAALREIPVYWEKDDHDIYADDCWPGRVVPKMGEFSFEEGQKIFSQQAPIPNPPYRSVRWGRELELWFTEGRDYRSPNNAPDGPGKTIWGEPQKRWLKQSLRASDARWKVIVSPTPIVGPDRPKKADNHANRAFEHEGNEFRRWVRDQKFENLFVACGDRHWQYHSVHPETGLNEFSCGPASDQHAGGSPGEDPKYHRFHRQLGGFLLVRAVPRGGNSHLVFELRDVHGDIVYEKRYES